VAADARKDGVAAPVSLRSQAVENVDARYGYTYEFSHSPEWHLAEYDEEEHRLTAIADRCPPGCAKCADAYLAAKEGDPNA